MRMEVEEHLHSYFTSLTTVLMGRAVVLSFVAILIKDLLHPQPPLEGDSCRNVNVSDNSCSFLLLLLINRRPRETATTY